MGTSASCGVVPQLATSCGLVLQLATSCGLVLQLATSCGRTKLFATAPDGGRGMVRLRAGSLTPQHPPSQLVTTCRIFQDRLEQEYSRISRNALNMRQTTGPQFMSPSPPHIDVFAKEIV